MSTVKEDIRELTFGQAINEAISEEMRRDPTVFVIGEDVAEAGTPFKVLTGLVEEFGTERVIDSPISEPGITGLGVDACMDYLNPSMYASMTKRVDIAVYETILSAYAGKFQGGFTSGGLVDGWVGMCRLPSEETYWEELFDFTHAELPEDIAAKVAEARGQIISGDITVPSGYD